MKKYLLILLLIILPSFSVLLQPGYFTMHDDLQSMRQLQLDKCFKDGQIPCRWVPDMGYGFGYPLFNFYPPLPFYLGQPIRMLGLQYIDVVKVVGVLGFLVCALSMYLLAREFWGRKGALLSSTFYTYAPYHSVDFWVRGAMNEFWAMAFYPLIFWSTYKLIQNPKWTWVPVVGFSVAGLMLSHNPMLMIFTPIYLVWIVYWWLRAKSIFSFRYLFVSAIWVLGLAAFFTLPVLAEAKFVHTESLVVGYFNYLAHFADIKQLFLNINWGYGPSLLGPRDGLSFALGYLHWIVPLVIIGLTPFVSRLRSNKYLVALVALFTLASLFMTHSKSTWLWDHIAPIQYLQFPWRFMTLAAFTASFLSGAIVLALNKRFFTSLLITALLLLNANYFRPDKWFTTMTDKDKFTGKSWQLLITASIFDYLPKGAPLPPPDKAGGDLNILGSGTYKTQAKTSNFQSYSVQTSAKNVVVELQTFYFPGWKIWLDGKEVAIDHTSDKLLGRMQISVPSGSHQLVARFTDTPIRSLANILSLVSWVMLVLSLPMLFKGNIHIWKKTT